MADTSRASWKMGGITNDAVENYMYSLVPPRDEVLSHMEAEAAKRNIPIVGPLVGRLLHMIATIAGAQRIFEMGSAIGYSTIWWARAVGAQGRVTYTDGNPRNAAEARGYFDRAGVAGRIDVRTGDAIEILSEQPNESFDIIFCDIDKTDYPRALKVAIPRVKKGGLFVADNVLYKGTVADPSSGNESTKGILEFNRLMYASQELDPVILPLRDGVSIARKL